MVVKLYAGAMVRDRSLLIFDGDCSFCRAWVDYWKRLIGPRLEVAPYQSAADNFPEIPREKFAQSVQLVQPNGEVFSGAHAAFASLALIPEKRWLLSLYDHVPGFAGLTEAVYHVVARHRSLAYRATKWIWGVPVQLPLFELSTWLFLRFLAAIYLIAFASFGSQAAGLIGSRGIVPAREFVDAVRKYYGASGIWHVPTILWWNSGDVAIKATWVAGICLSLLMLFGMNSRWLRLMLFVLYLSLTVAGQQFMGYQWDALLLETGALAVFLGNSKLVHWLNRWLLFRLMLLSGAVKLLSGDAAWRGFSALPIHYQTQPLPTPLAWYVFQGPAWFHRSSQGLVFFVELLVPFFMLAPRRFRHLAALVTAGFQVLIFLTGNYAFFNLLTIALCLLLLDDAFLRRFLPQALADRLLRRAGPTWPRFKKTATGTFAVLVLLVSVSELAETFFHLHWTATDAVIGAVTPFEIVNTYGLFAVMTTSRTEIVIEGSNDGSTWQLYEFRYKPGDVHRRPPWIEPHQPRLDWQMWFAALGDYRSDPWILHFLGALLEGSPDVLDLLAYNPFPDRPPQYIRATLYEYRFSNREERRKTGQWWEREVRGPYLPPIALQRP
jgi:lipase maturation factor 1